MTTNGTGLRIGVTVLALGASLLAIPISQAQRAAGIARVGWLEVCGPGPRRPISIFSGLGWRTKGRGEEPHHRAAICRLPIRPDAGIGRRPRAGSGRRSVHHGREGGASRRRSREDDTARRLLVRPVRARHAPRPAGWKSDGCDRMTTELSPKRLELLKELVPNVSRVMFLHDPEAAPNAFKMTQEAAPRLGISLQVAQVTAADELLPELAMIAKQRPDALFVYPDVVLSSHPRPQQLADFALGPLADDACVPFFRGRRRSHVLRRRPVRDLCERGGAGGKILDGARPSDLPLRQATRFELVINDRTAKALGVRQSRRRCCCAPTK